MATVNVLGTSDVLREMRRLAKAYPKAFGAALYKLGVVIMSDALPRTPVEFGVLRASGYVSAPRGSGSNTGVELGFGTVYAVPQHERMDYKHPRGGGPKYLERAVSAVAPNALALLAKWAADPNNAGGWGQSGGMPTRPKTGSTTTKRRSAKRRLARGAANVRKRTGR